MSFLLCSEVAPLRVLRAGADLANQATLHQAGKACACRAWSACDLLRDLIGGQSVAVRECIEDRLIDAVRRRHLPPRDVELPDHRVRRLDGHELTASHGYWFVEPRERGLRDAAHSAVVALFQAWLLELSHTRVPPA